MANHESQTGKIAMTEGRFFLEMAGQRIELPAEVLGDRELAGKEVEVLPSCATCPRLTSGTGCRVPGLRLPRLRWQNFIRPSATTPLTCG